MPVDLSQYTFPNLCSCGQPAEYLAKGCMDAEPVSLCGTCYQQGMDVIVNYIKEWQRIHRRVLICGDCHRPVINLDTHLEVRRLRT